MSSHSPGTLWEVVVAGKMKNHFTLPLVERKSMSLAGYVHASWTHPVLMEAHFRGFMILSDQVAQGRLFMSHLLQTSYFFVLSGPYPHTVLIHIYIYIYLYMFLKNIQFCVISYHIISCFIFLYIFDIGYSYIFIVFVLLYYYILYNIQLYHII